MVPRQLGHTGLTVSPLGLGTTKVGRNTDIKYPKPFELPSDQQVRELLDASLRLGVNLIDTAPAYGLSEQRLGPILRTKRDQLVVCTKAGEQYDNGRSTYDFSARAIESSLDNSLRFLQTDHVDILLLHSNGQDLEILTQTDALEGLHRLKKKGKTRTVGISAKTETGILEACRVLDVVMAPFSQQDSSLNQPLKIAHKAGLGVLAIKGLFSGCLDARSAIEFVLRQPFIDALVLGTINPTHLEEAVAAANLVCRTG